MYAIIEDGGKQYKVEEGTVLSIDYREIPEDQEQVEFDSVLMYRDESGTVVGQPRVAGAKVIGKVHNIVADPKLYPMQKRRRKNSQRRIGHRQKFVKVEITNISKA